MRRAAAIIFIFLSTGLAAQAQSQAPVIVNPADSIQADSSQVVERQLTEKELLEKAILEKQLLAKLDKKNGFRDVQFGTHIKFFKKVSREWQVEEDYNCRRATDKLSVNGMPLTEIVYGFHKGRLNHIYITAPGIENSRELLKFFQSVYGPGTLVYEETAEFDNMVEWAGKKVILTYSEVASKKEGFFHFFTADK
jgi:hypothetical protein